MVVLYVICIHVVMRGKHREGDNPRDRTMCLFLVPGLGVRDATKRPNDRGRRALAEAVRQSGPVPGILSSTLQEYSVVFDGAPR